MSTPVYIYYIYIILYIIYIIARLEFDIRTYFLGYVTYLCENHPEIIDDGITESMKFTADLVKKLKISTQPVVISTSQAAELLLGKCNMSQRSYKNLKRIMKENDVKFPKV